jgi:hypothetical protein
VPDPPEPLELLDVLIPDDVEMELLVSPPIPVELDVAALPPPPVVLFSLGPHAEANVAIQVTRVADVVTAHRFVLVESMSSCTPVILARKGPFSSFVLVERQRELDNMKL